MAATHLIDTSAFAALRDRDDASHGLARAMARDTSARFHTTEEVLGETYTLLRRKLGFATAMETAASARASAVITVHVLDESDAARVWERLRELRALPLSHADATLIVLGERLGIRTVFSFDSDFALAGFTLVPGPSR